MLSIREQKYTSMYFFLIVTDEPILCWCYSSVQRFCACSHHNRPGFTRVSTRFTSFFSPAKSMCIWIGLFKLILSVKEGVHNGCDELFSHPGCNPTSLTLFNGPEVKLLIENGRMGQ